MPRNPDYNLEQSFPRGEAHSFSPEAFAEAIETQGVPLIHHRSFGCPVGLVHKDDTNTRIHVDHTNCSNGFRYKQVGELSGLFSGNSSSFTPNDTGMLDGSTVQVTLPREYDDGSAVHVTPFDRFYSADENYLWPHWEFIQHSPAGIDKLRWPATIIENVVDSRNVEYTKDVDYCVRDGKLVWLPGGKQPGFDPDTTDQRGLVVCVWYLYKPYWYVQRLSHDSRIGQITTDDGERKLTRFPLQCTFVREFVFEDVQAKDATAPGEKDERSQRGPDEGGYTG